MNQELNNWILQARSTGHTDEQIKQYLVSHGYNTQQIEDAFLDLDAPSNQPQPDTNTPSDVTETQSEPVTLDNTEPKSEDNNSETIPSKQYAQIDSSETLNTNQTQDTELVTDQAPVVESKESSKDSDNSTLEQTPDVAPEKQSKPDDSITAVPNLSEANPSEETNNNPENTQEDAMSTSEPEIQDTIDSEDTNGGVSLSFGSASKKAEQQIQELESTPIEQEEPVTTEQEQEINNQEIKNIEQQIDSIYESDNHSTNYQKKSSVIPTLIFLLLLFGGITGAYYYYTNYMNPTYVEPEVVIEQAIPAAKIIPKIDPQPEITPEPETTQEQEIITEPIELPEPEEPIPSETQELPDPSTDK